MPYSLEWEIWWSQCPQHKTHVSKLFSNCAVSGSCLPALHLAGSGLLRQSVHKTCLIRGSILQRAQGLSASEQVLSRLQNNALWCCLLAKDVRVVTLCTKWVFCNGVWTKLLCCKLAIISPANCKQRLHKLSRGWWLPNVLRKKKKKTANNLFQE